MSTGQCKVDPPTGIAGAIYTALTGDADNGLAGDATVSGSTMRKLLGALLQAIAGQVNASMEPAIQQQDNAGGNANYAGGGWANAVWAAWNPTVAEDGVYRLRIDTSCYMTVAADAVKYQILVDGAAPAQPVNGPIFYFNTLGEHNRISWEFAVTLTAGAHTFQLQWDTVFGLGTLNTNGDDCLLFTLSR